jgi:hypothetical protein
MQNAMHSYHHDICYAVQENEDEEAGKIVEVEAPSPFFLSFGLLHGIEYVCSDVVFSFQGLRMSFK